MRAEGVGERDMGHDTIFEEAVGATARAVEDLIWHNKVERRLVLAQATHRAHRNNPLDAERLERVDIRARGNFGWRDAMPAPMSWKERHRLLAKHAGQDGVARRAKGCLRHDLRDVG